MAAPLHMGRNLARIGAIFCPVRIPRYASEYYELGSVPFRRLAMKRREFVFLIGGLAARSARGANAKTGSAAYGRR